MPNLPPHMKLAIAESFKEQWDLWTFMKCDDQMLEQWISRCVFEYYRIQCPPSPLCNSLLCYLNRGLGNRHLGVPLLLLQRGTLFHRISLCLISVQHLSALAVLPIPLPSLQERPHMGWAILSSVLQK